ncbi:outer membrane beta-barrel protein [Flavobacterium hauense]
MGKIALSIFALLCFTTVFGQAREELNFGLVGINYEIPVHRDITIAPGIGTSLDLDWLNLGVKANYYFDNLFDISDEAWDVYGGVNAGYSVDMDDNDNNGDDESDINIGLHVGGRWFWNDKWGLYVELAGGNVSGFSPGIGVTMKL